MIVVYLDAHVPLAQIDRNPEIEWLENRVCMFLESGVRVRDSLNGCACVWESSVTLETGVRGCACLSTTAFLSIKFY